MRYTKVHYSAFILLYDHAFLSLRISLFKPASAPRSNCPYRRCRWPRENARLLLASDHSHALLPLPRWPCAARCRGVQFLAYLLRQSGHGFGHRWRLDRSPPHPLCSRSCSSSAFTDDGTRTVMVSVRSSFFSVLPLCCSPPEASVYVLCTNTDRFCARLVYNFSPCTDPEMPGPRSPSR